MGGDTIGRQWPGSIGCARLGDRALGIEFDPGLHFGVARLDSVQTGTHEVFGLELACGNASRGFSGAQVIELFHRDGVIAFGVLVPAQCITARTALRDSRCGAKTSSTAWLLCAPVPEWGLPEYSNACKL